MLKDYLNLQMFLKNIHNNLLNLNFISLIENKRHDITWEQKILKVLSEYSIEV